MTALLLDNTRLFRAAETSSPRGIDKVDLGYHRIMTERWPGPFYAMATTPWGLRLFTRDQCRRQLDGIDEIWGEARQDDDPAEAVALQWLAGDRTARDARQKRRLFERKRRLLTLLHRGAVSFGTPAARFAKDAIYLNVGQSTLARRDLDGWLARHPAARVAALIHDTIPVDCPDIVPPQNRRPFLDMLGWVARTCDLVLTPSRFTAETLRGHLHGHGAQETRIESRHLPLDDTFASPSAATGAPRADGLAPYFLCCGTIEPRKNQLMLLDVWRRLRQQRGERTPLLILAGSIGSGGKVVAQTIDADPALQRDIRIVSGLTSGGMSRLVAGAQALLMPSLAEGFGLPPLEAMAVGTVPIVSDLPVHREATEGLATYLPVAEPQAWVDAIAAACDDPEWLASRRRALATWTPRSWSDYADEVLPLLVDLAASRSPRQK